MQYQLSGTDAQGRLIYEPVRANSVAPQPAQCCQNCSCKGSVKPVKAQSESVFAPWFVMEAGVISISLRNMTIVSALSISVALLAILYASCNDGTGRYQCTYERFPMVSDVINQEMYNRIFILMTATFMYAVQQVNIRAYYKKLYGLVSNSSNDTMFWFGFASLIALPMVGIFDESMWSTLHVISAGIFFGGFMIYGILLARNLNNHRSAFPAEEQQQISTINTCSTTMVMITCGFFLAGLIHGSKGITAIMEWATVLYFVNFFSIASFVNPFYDSVHEPGTLVPKGQDVEAASEPVSTEASVTGSVVGHMHALN